MGVAVAIACSIAIVILLAGVLAIWMVCRGSFDDQRKHHWENWISAKQQQRRQLANGGGASVHIAMVATPNYDDVAQFSMASLRRYARRHGYTFDVYRNLLTTDCRHCTCAPHLSKISASIDAMKRCRGSADYMVITDADVIIMHDWVTIDDVIETSSAPDAPMHLAPDCLSDMFISPSTHFNTGFIVFNMRHVDENIASLERWLDTATSSRACCAHPFDQLAFELGRRHPAKWSRCDDVRIGTIPCQLFGVAISKVWKQAYGTIDKRKHMERLWREAGRPPLVVGPLPDTGLIRIVGMDRNTVQKRKKKIAHDAAATKLLKLKKKEQLAPHDDQRDSENPPPFCTRTTNVERVRV